MLYSFNLYYLWLLHSRYCRLCLCHEIRYVGRFGGRSRRWLELEVLLYSLPHCLTELQFDYQPLILLILVLYRDCIFCSMVDSEVNFDLHRWRYWLPVLLYLGHIRVIWLYRCHRMLACNTLRVRLLCPLILQALRFPPCFAFPLEFVVLLFRCLRSPCRIRTGRRWSSEATFGTQPSTPLSKFSILTKLSAKVFGCDRSPRW